MYVCIYVCIYIRCSSRPGSVCALLHTNVYIYIYIYILYNYICMYVYMFVYLYTILEQARLGVCSMCTHICIYIMYIGIYIYSIYIYICMYVCIYIGLTRPQQPSHILPLRYLTPPPCIASRSARSVARTFSFGLYTLLALPKWFGVWQTKGGAGGGLTLNNGRAIVLQ